MYICISTGTFFSFFKRLLFIHYHCYWGLNDNDDDDDGQRERAE